MSPNAWRRRAAFSGEVDTRWLLGSLIMFALPVLDTSLAFARRWINKRPVFSADRFHFHHQLVARGLTVRKTVILSYGLSIFFAMLGSAIVYMRTRYAGMIYLVVFGSLLAFNAYMVLLARTSAGLAASYSFVNPVIALLLGIGFGGESVTAQEWAAAGVILAGVVLLVVKPFHAGTARP